MGTLRLICLACIVIGYLFGSFQTAYFYGMHKGVDVRSKGSGNLGTTNMFRVLGIRAGLCTFVGDIAKVFIAEALTYLVFVVGAGFEIDRIAIMLYTGLGCVLGHDFPFYLHFKGGKGVAACAAVLISIWDWKLIVIGIIVFFGIALCTLYVSVASMCLVIIDTVAFIIFDQLGYIKLDPAWRIDCYCILILLSLLVIFQHRKNIYRLAHGTENKFHIMSQKELNETGKKEQEDD